MTDTKFTEITARFLTGEALTEEDKVYLLNADLRKRCTHLGCTKLADASGIGCAAHQAAYQREINRCEWARQAKERGARR